ncbi:hypothetical protein A5647_07895 [Mycobacterium sp. 1100029.7]|nr:hypothetical protein A5647_07895 [Mycobacterium sp. 1100029.7]
MPRRLGQSANVDSDNDDNYNLLDQSESLDSDEVRNDDGDEAVDPPDRWIKAEDDESLDERLAAEIPDEAPEDLGTAEQPAEDGALVMVSDDELDRIDPNNHGRSSGQIDGTPEDGESFYNVEK